MEVSAGRPSGRLAVDLVDKVVGEDVIVPVPWSVLGGCDVGGHRQDQQ